MAQSNDGNQDTNNSGDDFGFAPDHDQPIPYRQRIRDYYVTLGYGKPYAWAHYSDVPFTPLKKPGQVHV